MDTIEVFCLQLRGAQQSFIWPLTGQAPVLAGVSQCRPQQLMAEVPSKWERLGDLVLLPADSFRAAKWAALGSDLWTAVATVLKADRIALQAPVANTGVCPSLTPAQPT